MTAPTVPERTTKRADQLVPGDLPVESALKPTGYQALAVDLRKIAEAFDRAAHVEMRKHSYIRLNIQPGGTDAQIIERVNAIGELLFDTPGQPDLMSDGSYHYGVEGEIGLVAVHLYSAISTETVRAREAADRAAADAAELARLRAEVARLEARVAGPHTQANIDAAKFSDDPLVRAAAQAYEDADDDPTGLTYGREDDDPQVVRPHSPRVPLHVGVREVDGGELVDETPAHLDVYGDPIPADQICVASLHIPTPGESCGWCGMQGMRSGQHIKVMAGTEDGVASARCACGTTVDGFHSIAEASAELAKHIADATGPVVDPTGRGRESDPDWVAGFGPVPGSDLIGESR